MIAASLIEILCCPETHQPLRLAESSILAGVNQQITSGTVKNRAGNPITVPIEQGLIRQDGKYLYPVWKDIPVMRIDEAIPLG